MQDMPSMTNEFYDPTKDPDVHTDDVQSASTVDECLRLAGPRRKEDILPEDQAEFNRQLAVMIEQQKNFPSIVAWVRFSHLSIEGRELIL